MICSDAHSTITDRGRLLDKYLTDIGWLDGFRLDGYRSVGWTQVGWIQVGYRACLYYFPRRHRTVGLSDGIRNAIQLVTRMGYEKPYNWSLG
jgi:cytosine/adenosine deaminase-related metal-dependent hydrolase